MHFRRSCSFGKVQPFTRVRNPIIAKTKKTKLINFKIRGTIRTVLNGSTKDSKHLKVVATNHISLIHLALEVYIYLRRLSSFSEEIKLVLHLFLTLLKTEPYKLHLEQEPMYLLNT